MKASRRTFIGMIASAIAAPAIVVRAAQKAGAGINLDEILEQLYRVKSNRGQLTARWMQTTRHTHCSSLAYEDTIDEIFSPPGDPGVRLRWHERRKERSRARMSKLRQQRPLPLP